MEHDLNERKVEELCGK